MKKRESVFVVSARDDVADSDEFIVVGAYRSFGDAVKACVDEIMERMRIPSIAATIRNDERRDHGMKTPETDAEWREYLEHELVAQHCYYPQFGGDMLRYDIDEAGVAGSPERGAATENVGDANWIPVADNTPAGRKARGRVEVVAAMDALMHRLNDEESLVPWLSDGVPDDMDHNVFPRDGKAKLDEYMDVYGDMSDEDFDDMVRLFATIVRRECFKTTYVKRAFC